MNRVVVIIGSGIVEDVISKEPVEMVIVDHDDDGADPASIKKVEGEDGYVYDGFQLPEIDPARVDKIYDEVGRPLPPPLQMNLDIKEVSIDTPGGKLTARTSIDSDYPGIWIELNGEGLAVVEFDKDKGEMFARVWKEGCQCDPAYTARVKRCDICDERAGEIGEEVMS